MNKNYPLQNQMFADLQEFGSPATVSQIGGRYFGFVCGSAVPAGLAAKNLATFWDQNSAMYVLSPITSKLESIVESWIKEIFHLSDEYVTTYLSGSSMATFCGLAAARYRLLEKQQWDISQRGLFNAPPLRIVTGRHAHSTVLKAISLLGLGTNNIEWVGVDDQGRIRTEEIPVLDSRTILILQAGNVNSGSFDDFKTICTKAKNEGAWIHIDGAFGLWASASEELKSLTEGIEMGNSLSVDGHKTLNTPYDCGILICSDQIALKSALHMSGSYIVTSENRDGMFYTPEMSRRARVLELWATMKYLGKEGINQMVNNMHRRARQFSELLSGIDGFEVLNDVTFNQVLVACKTDELTEKTMKKIQEDRLCWVGGSQWFGRKVIRISVSSWATTEDDVNKTIESFKKALI
ncbi:MAG: aminotransferase class V-fold PLP-dependent enzyme [Spirochaetaceae bacterium]|jgi:glutamate/tyrosine decarboxylase-like PLP-dependent enzyme|nr:aminotransferase class V-fold PLP-dependent enzyme [Spirochaetaceae bacterium]